MAAPDHDAGPVPELPEGEGPWAAVVTVADGWVTDVAVHDPAVTVVHGDDDPALGAVLGEAPDSFVQWTVALAPTPVVVRVARGAKVAHPVLVRSAGVTVDGLSTPRLLIAADEGAEVTVVEHQTSRPGARLVLPLVEIDVAARGRVAYTVAQELDGETWQLADVVARVGQEGHLVVGAVALGGDYTRLRTDCRLEGRGASGDLLAAYFGEDDQTLDFRTFQDHLAPDTTSDLLFKGAVGGRSRSIYTGLITVRPDARGTNAYQTNRNLKLSEEAWAESVPNLEIQNNDVRCSHASTVGPIDTDQRFYLESRGVPPEVAERLVVSGFFADVLHRMPAPAPVLAAIAAGIDARLERQVGPAAVEEVSG